MMVTPQITAAPIHADSMVSTAIDCLRSRLELIALFSILLVLIVVYTLQLQAIYSAVNVAGPAALATTLLATCYYMTRCSTVVIWAPLFWFRVACAAYYGIGAMVPHVGNAASKDYIYRVYAFGETTNLKVNIICCAGIATTLAFSWMFVGSRRGGSGRTSRQTNDTTTIFMMTFLVVGASLRYLVVLPYTFGLTSSVLPGFIISAAGIYYAGVYLSVFQAVRRRGIYIIAASLIVTADVLVSVASFAKTELIILIIFTFLGYISHVVNVRRLLVGAAVVILSFGAFQPLVGYGREVLMMRYGQIRGADLQERLKIVQGYLQNGEAVERDNLALVRLSYVNVDAFVVDQYDGGAPGRTLTNAATVIVPRALWPDKPIISQLGEDLNYLMLGRHGSSLGVGHFAEAYWNFGWWGILPLMAVLAWILATFSRVSVRIMSERNWLFLPVVFLGVNIGIRVDGHFVPDLIGASWMALVLGTALWLIRPFCRTFDAPVDLGQASTPPPKSLRSEQRR